MKGLNLAGFKKVAEDQNYALMRHERGHDIKIYLHALPKFQQEQIRRIPLAQGGQVKGVHESGMEPGQSTVGEIQRHGKSSNDNYANSVSKGIHKAKLSELKSMPNPKLQGLADGGSVTPQGPLVPQPMPIQQDQTKTLAAQDSMRKAFNFDDGGPVNDYSDSNDSPSDSKSADPNKGVTINVNASPQGDVQPANMRVPASISAPQTTGIQQEAQKTLGSVGQAQGAIQQQQQIDAQKAQAQVPAIQENMQANQNIAVQNQQAKDMVNSAADRLKAYQDAHPEDQNQYVKNMPTGEKVATAIGLIVGGFHSGFSGQSNAALDFLNNKISQNIQQQRDNFGNQKSVFGAYHEAFGDDTVASNLATANAKERLANQINLAAQKLGTPQAQANAATANAKLMMDSNQLRQESAGALGNAYRSKGMMPQNMGASNSSMGIKNTSAPGNPQGQGAPLLKPDAYADSPILAPDAEEKLNQMQYSTSQDKANYPAAFDQYTQAQQADTLLGQLHDVHQQMYEDANTGGSSGYLRRHDPSASVPLVGHALSNMLIQPATDTQTNRRYDANKTRLLGDVANALRGTNVGSEDIARIVNDNSPEHGDTPEMAAQKERNIRVFIKNGVKKSLIKDKKMTN